MITAEHYEELAASLEYMRDAMRAMVAGLMEDGYTEKQSREVAVAIFSRRTTEEDADE